MDSENNESKEVVKCPKCGKPLGEGDCNRCENFRMAIKINGRVIVMM